MVAKYHQKGWSIKRYVRPSERADKKVAVFDYDDTIFFTDVALKLASKEAVNKELTRSQIKKLSPDIITKIFTLAGKKYYPAYRLNKLVLDKCKRYRSKGYDIIVLTTRWSTLRRYTLKTLVNNNIPFQSLVLDKNGSTDGAKFKIDYLKSLLSRYNEIIFFDNSIKFIRKVNALPSLKRVSLYLVNRTRIIKYRAG